MPETASPADHNAAVWRAGAWVSYYDQSRLSPAEILLLLRYRESLSGRVLELGPGAGRVTSYLAELAAELTALEISVDMANAARRRVPSANVLVGDMQDLGGMSDASFDAVVAACNILDVLDDPERRRLLAEIRRILVLGGVLLFSSHNRDAPVRRPWQAFNWRRPRAFANDVLRFPMRIGSYRRLRAFERDGATTRCETTRHTTTRWSSTRSAPKRSSASLRRPASPSRSASPTAVRRSR